MSREIKIPHSENQTFSQITLLVSTQTRFHYRLEADGITSTSLSMSCRYYPHLHRD